jgi:hypothetical protein
LSLTTKRAAGASCAVNQRPFILRCSIFWYGDNEFLALHQGTKETAHATWMIGHDQGASNYTILYFDDRRFSRVYKMSFENGIWKIWRNAPGFVQSFEGTVSEDKNTITGAWGKSADGKKWEHDFDLEYRRKDG